VPALVPLCIGDASAREIAATGPLMLALAAVAIHTAAMLAITGLIATGLCRGFCRFRRQDLQGNASVTCARATRRPGARHFSQ
jgi:hypothetical protein